MGGDANDSVAPHDLSSHGQRQIVLPQVDPVCSRRQGDITPVIDHEHRTMP